MGGRRSPDFLRRILDDLQTTVPHVRRFQFRGVGHEAPVHPRRARRVADALRTFFAARGVEVRGQRAE